MSDDEFYAKPERISMILRIYSANVRQRMPVGIAQSVAPRSKVINPNEQRSLPMAQRPKPTVYRDDSNGQLFHDECFEDGESRDGYTPVTDLDTLEMDDTCESCGGFFLGGLEPDDTEDPDDEDEE